MDLLMGALPPSAQALTLVREAKGLTQRELAMAAGVSQAVLSKAEGGLAGLGPRVGQVAEALGCPASVLVDGFPLVGAPVTCLHHRRRTSQVNAKAQKRVQALVQLTRVSVKAMVTAAGETPQVDQLVASRPLLGGPAEAAVAVRRRFGLGEGPIGDAMGVVERTGTVVVMRSLAAGGQDAVSSWAGDADTPLVLVSTGLPVDRQRFTVLHELGHLLLHTLPDEGQELEAHRFAAELLMPASAAVRDLAGLSISDLRRLAGLKETWGLSIAALIQRALDVECISQDQFRQMRIRLTRLGWHRAEPVTLPEEQPTRLAGYVAAARRRGFTDEQLAEAAQMTLPKFRSATWLSGASEEGLVHD